MSNLSLARLAARRAADGEGPRQNDRCQQWVRLCVQALYGDRWDKWLWQATAAKAGEAFYGGRAELAPLGVKVIRSTNAGASQVGDLLYSTIGSGGSGHVSIRVEGNRVAENSSTRIGRTHGAIGFRGLEFVRFDTIVRLPDPAAEAAAKPAAAGPRDLLAQVYAVAQGEPDVLKALNRFRRHPAVAAFLE